MMMPDVSPTQTDDLHRDFPRRLKSWRQKRRISQLDLALASGVSQRHLSFLESGRAQPGRDMILRISETLEVPLRERNAWLMSAGFAPIFRTRPLDHPQMAQVTSAVRMMLANHEPFPAVAVDRAWNIVLANNAFGCLTGLLSNSLWAEIGGPQRNLMRLFFHPRGLRPLVANWSVIAPLLWCRAQREADALGGADMRKVLDDLEPLQDAGTLTMSEDTALLPVLPLTLRRDGLELSMFTVIATFGTAQDVTAEELRIESLFPADPATESLFHQLAKVSADR